MVRAFPLANQDRGHADPAVRPFIPAAGRDRMGKRQLNQAEEQVYQDIMVAVDDSETSQRALNVAIGLAKGCGARLEIVHAVDESLFPTHARGGALLVDPVLVQRALEEEGQRLLDAAAASARDAGVEAQTRVLASETHHTADQIAEAADAAKAELLVVGSHGRRGVQRLLLGSVAERLVRKANVSVLIVRGEAP